MSNRVQTNSTRTATAGLKQAALAGSALALFAAAPANASVVTTTLGSPATLTLNSPSSFVFDINNDGTNDFTVMSSGGCSASTTCSISVVPGAGNQVYIDKFTVAPGPQAAREFSFGAYEHSLYSNNFFKYLSPNPGSLAESVNGTAPQGDWAFDGDTGVLGLEFMVGGKNYLGFIHGTTSNPSNDTSLSIAFDSYGYETNPVPEADTLSLLAMGVAGLGVLRRRRKVVKA
jgi:hypothetical protein